MTCNYIFTYNNRPLRDRGAQNYTQQNLYTLHVLQEYTLLTAEPWQTIKDLRVNNRNISGKYLNKHHLQRPTTGLERELWLTL